MNTNSVFKYRDQMQVIEALHKWQHVCMSQTKPSLDDIICLLASVGKGRRLSDQFLHKLPDEERENHELNVALAAADLVLRLKVDFNQMLRIGIAETEIRELEEALAQDDLDSLELLHRLLVLDEQLCVLSVLNQHQVVQDIVRDLAPQVNARLSVCAGISKQASRFVERHQPQNTWGNLWHNIATAQQELTELNQAYEAELDHYLTELDHGADIPELPPAIMAILDQVHPPASTSVPSPNITPENHTDSLPAPSSRWNKILQQASKSMDRITFLIIGRPASPLALADDGRPQPLTRNQLNQPPTKTWPISGNFVGELEFAISVFDESDQNAKRVILSIMHEGVQVEKLPLDLSNPATLKISNKDGEECGRQFGPSNVEEIRFDVTQHSSIVVELPALNLTVPITLTWQLKG